MTEPLRYHRLKVLESRIDHHDDQGRPVYRAMLGEKKSTFKAPETNNPITGAVNAVKKDWHDLWEGSGKVHWLNRAVQRDASMGISLGYLAMSLMGALVPGMQLGALAQGAIVGTGGLIGAVSDYTRNTKEMQQTEDGGALIKPPQYFNRDAIRGAIGWGVLSKLAVSLGGAALNFIPGVNIASGALVMASWGVAAMGAGYGAMRGSENGYNRMQDEYAAMAIKHQNPEVDISFSKGKHMVRGHQGPEQQKQEQAAPAHDNPTRRSPQPAAGMAPDHWRRGEMARRAQAPAAAGVAPGSAPMPAGGGQHLAREFAREQQRRGLEQLQPGRTS